MEASPRAPTWEQTANAVTDIQLHRYSASTVELLQASIQRWAQELSTPARRSRRISYRSISRRRARSGSVFQPHPTSLALSGEQVDQLIAAGRELLRDNVEFRRFVERSGRRSALIGWSAPCFCCTVRPFVCCRGVHPVHESGRHPRHRAGRRPEECRAPAQALGIHSVQDLLFHLPIRYQDRTRIVPIGSLRAGDQAVIQGEVELADIRFGRRRSLLVRLADGTGSITLRSSISVPRRRPT